MELTRRNLLKGAAALGAAGAVPATLARPALAQITQRRNAINEAAEPPMRLAYRRAKKNIESGGQSYTVDSTQTDQIPNGV